MIKQNKKKVLLHICCAPCATIPIKRLQESYEITGYFYNPNIFPVAEYEFRIAENEKYLASLSIENISGEYDQDSWYKRIRGFENEPEKGRRCEICYRVRLESTAALAKEMGIGYFTSTLSLSPHKPYEIIKRIGDEIAQKYGLIFLDENFKKKDGFKESCEMSKDYGMYRQAYCGCEFSRKV